MADYRHYEEETQYDRFRDEVIEVIERNYGKLGNHEEFVSELYEKLKSFIKEEK